MDKYIKFSAVMEYLRSRNDEARKCGHEETYYDLLTIIDGLKNVETVPASALDKDTNAPTKSALDHIHNVVAENERKRGYEQAKAKYDAKLEEIKSRFKDFYFNKGYDAGYKEGYERGKADAAISARTLAKHLTSNFDDVLSVADVLEELEALEAVAKGERHGRKSHLHSR